MAYPEGARRFRIPRVRLLVTFVPRACQFTPANAANARYPSPQRNDGAGHNASR
jgi:hypothetical protein